MDHSVLTRHLDDPWVEPDLVPAEVRKTATGQHDHFKRSFTRYHAENTAYNSMLKRLASMLAMVRNNLQHGEKARRRRDYEVADVVRPLLDETVELILDYPSRRLGTYGTLRDDAVFKDVAGIVPHRVAAAVRGVVCHERLFKVFYSDPRSTATISLATFVPDRSTYLKLDDYEGAAYRRILITATVDSRTVVCNIYTGSESADA